MSDLIQVSGRKYKTAAHALAMGNMAKTINAAKRINVSPAHPVHWSQSVPELDDAQRQALLAEKLLSRTQQYVVGGLLELIKEINATVQEINVQAAAHELGLPKLVLNDLIGFGDAIYKRIEDGLLAAGKLGQEVVVGRLAKATELYEFKQKIIKELGDKRHG